MNDIKRCEECNHFNAYCSCPGRKVEWNSLNLPLNESTVMCYWKEKRDSGCFEMRACFYEYGEFSYLDALNVKVERLPDYWREFVKGEMPDDC